MKKQHQCKRQHPVRELSCVYINALNLPRSIAVAAR